MIFIKIVNVITVFAMSEDTTSVYPDDDSNMATVDNILNDTVHTSTTITTTKYILISSVEDHRCK